MRLTVDCRNDVHNQDIEVANADIDVAISWLNKLDGRRHTLLNLERSDGVRLMIGGGPSWFIIVLEDEGSNLTLQNPVGAESEMIELCAGGQYGDYPKAYCVDQKQSEQTMVLFFEGNESNAAWE